MNYYIFFIIIGLTVVISVWYNERHHVNREIEIREEIALLKIGINFLHSLLQLSKTQIIDPKIIENKIKKFLNINDIIFLSLTNNKIDSKNKYIAPKDIFIIDYIEKHSTEIISKLSKDPVILLTINNPDFDMTFNLYIRKTIIINTRKDNIYPSNKFIICIQNEGLLLTKNELLLLDTALTLL